ncbi:MAG TPA: hypothetical protein GXX18_02320 [Bacillales bacterium]|nr:hypothetical protein [Bacillales bacterium]
MNILENKQGLKQFEVNATVELPISLIIEAMDINEAEFKADCQLNEMSIQQAFVTFLLQNGNVISPIVNDFFCQIDYVGSAEDERY